MDGKVSGWQLVVCDKSRLKGTGYSRAEALANRLCFVREKGSRD